MHRRLRRMCRRADLLYLRRVTHMLDLMPLERDGFGPDV